MSGLGSRKNDWRTNEGSFQQFQYVGPNGDLTQQDPAAIIPWTQNYQFEMLGFNAGNMNAQNWRADSNYAVYDIYQEHPEYFVPDTVGNLKRKLDNNKRIQEDVDAAYIEGETRVGDARFDLGLRYEKTKTAAQIANIRPASEVTAAGLSVSTVEGLLYQYNDGVYSKRRGEYEDWFLSGGVKYDFTEKLVGQLAFSEAILRPDYGNLGGVVSVNEDTMIVTVPNPELKPEHATKYFASLAVLARAVRSGRPVLLQARHEGHAGDRHRRSIQKMSASTPMSTPATPSAARRTCPAPAPTKD